jgi:quinol-cytochrome oxidoreductase complex cytochrome b subunit
VAVDDSFTDPASEHVLAAPSEARGVVDGLVRGLAAGMGLRELRAIFRGEPATERPSLRYRAHTNSLLLHLRPRTYAQASTRFTHTFRLGFFTTFFFFVEAITGLVLMLYYVPTPEGAYASIWRLMTRVPFGELLRDIHRLAAEGMVIFAILHLLRTFLTASHRGKRAFTWLTGVFLGLVTLALTFSGYLLPWDQLAYWAVTIGTSMAAAVPLIGDELNTLLRGGAEIGADGLLRFYLLHVILLPGLAGIALGVHYYGISRRHGLSLPAEVEEGELPAAARAEATRRVDFLPDLLTHEAFLVCVGLLALIAASVFLYNAPLETHANPQRTPLETEAPWFFLWVQGLLKLGDVTLMGVALPLALITLLLAAPHLDRSPHRRLRKRPLALAVTVMGMAGLLILSYMGTPRFGITLPPAVAIVQALAPEEGSGPLRSVPFDELPVGVYVVGASDPTGLPPAFRRVFEAYAQQVASAVADSRLPEAQAFLIVQDWQQDLKRVTLRIGWADAQAGGRLTYERDLYLHRQRVSEGVP